MKQIYLLAIGAMLLTSCGKQKENNETKDSTKTQPIDTVTTVEEIKPVVYKINLNKLTENKLFEYKSITKNIYHENTYSLHWPESAEGFDVAVLQKELRKWLKIDENKDVTEYIKNWVANTTLEGTIDYPLKEVKKRTDPSDDQKAAQEAGEEDPYEYQFDTECSKDVMMYSNDSINHIITYQEFFVENIGSGLGAGVLSGYDYLTYDYEAMKVVKLKDLVTNERLVLKQMKEQNAESTYEGLPSVESLPGAWFVTGNYIYFVFGKYEISFGADGCPDVGVDMSKCPDALTDYGKKILLGKD